jgi:hypothetical protein
MNILGILTTVLKTINKGVKLKILEKKEAM